MSELRIADISLTVVGVSAKSNWMFVEVTLDNGAVGLGEATLHGYEPLVGRWLDQHRAAIVGHPLSAMSEYLPVGRRTRAGLVAHAAISALEQARADLEAQAADLPLAAHQGAPGPVSVPLYANLNRGLVDRHPDAFAAQASAAVGSGHRRIKVAPFDGVRPDNPDGAANEALLRAGLDRIAAIRDAVGLDVAIFVDCHWRLTIERALQLVDEVAAMGVSWLECPVPELPLHFCEIARLRERTGEAGMILAGAELEIGLVGFRPFLELYDVIMPDIKYCGGPAELRRIADAAGDAGCRVAPHNPSGPVAHAHSVHAAAHPAVFLLEHQYGETPLFHRMVNGRAPATRNGLATSVDTPGLGIRLDHAACTGCEARRIASLD